MAGIENRYKYLFFACRMFINTYRSNHMVDQEARQIKLIANMNNYEKLAYKIFIEMKIPVYVNEPVYCYYPDFIGKDRNFILEVDGYTHDNKGEYDDNRSQILESFGFHVYRLDNRDITVMNITRIINQCPYVGLSHMRELMKRANETYRTKNYTRAHRKRTVMSVV